MKLPNFLKRIPRTPEERNKLKKERLLLLLGAVIMGAGFSPSPLPFLMFLGMIPYFMVIEKRQRFGEVNRATFLYIFLFGLCTIYWVGGFTQAKDAFLMTGGFILFFINPIAFLIPSTLYYLWREYIHRKSALFILPFFWLWYEYLYTLTDWSFPWLQLHNGISGFVSFIQIASLIGGWGLTLIIVYINVFLYYAYSNRKKRTYKFVLALAGAMTLIILPLLFGMLKLSQPVADRTIRQVTIGVVQPNLDPYDKWGEMQYTRILAQQLDKSRELIKSKPDIMIWPETAIPVYFMSPAFTSLQDSVFRFVTTNNINLISGMPDIVYFNDGDKLPPDAKYSAPGKFYYATYNAIIGFAPGQRTVQRYGKMKLVPFGEHVPFVDQFPIFGEFIKWGVGMTGWNVGRDTTVFRCKTKVSILHPILTPGQVDAVSEDSVNIGAVVCYESIYSDLVTQLANKGAQLLVVVTNDSWYGNTSGPYQHRDFARLRAVETGREVVRCANGGISCVIDKYGQIKTQTGMYETALFTHMVSLEDGTTLYMQYPHVLVDLSAMLSLCTIAGALIVSIRKKLA
jgi:apolipoprotein N-acyltransferase